MFTSKCEEVNKESRRERENHENRKRYAKQKLQERLANEGRRDGGPGTAGSSSTRDIVGDRARLFATAMPQRAQLHSLRILHCCQGNKRSGLEKNKSSHSKDVFSNTGLNRMLSFAPKITAC